MEYDNSAAVLATRVALRLGVVSALFVCSYGHQYVNDIKLTRRQVVGLTIYRLSLHPLAKYPGPLLAKVTNLYAVYHAYIGDLHLDMFRCHEMYGDFVRYGPNKVIINDQRAIKGTGCLSS